MEIDRPLKRLISLMNQKGFTTLYSCASDLYPIEDHTSDCPSCHLYITFKGDVERLAPLCMIRTKESIPWYIELSPDPTTLEPRWTMKFNPLNFEALERSHIRDICDQLIKIGEDFFEKYDN